MLAAALRGTEIAGHSLSEIPWATLESPCIVGMHWHRTTEFYDLLQRRAFEVIVTVRHPLDVLISILHFAAQEPATARWLEGEGGDESTLAGADPASPQFLEYALSRRAFLLLRVSAEWYGVARVVARYEQFVADPENALTKMLACLGLTALDPLDKVINSVTMEQLRPLAPHHFWRGEPGLWRRMIPTDYQQQIYECHRDVFQLWGYDRPDDGSLSPRKAQENWAAFCDPSHFSSQPNLFRVLSN